MAALVVPPILSCGRIPNMCGCFGRVMTGKYLISSPKSQAGIAMAGEGVSSSSGCRNILSDGRERITRYAYAHLSHFGFAGQLITGRPGRIVIRSRQELVASTLISLPLIYRVRWSSPSFGLTGQQWQGQNYSVEVQ